MAIYFIQSGDKQSSPIKIGYVQSGRSVMNRISVLQIGNPEHLYLLAQIPNAGIKTEQWLHRAFASQRIRGEWFRPSKALMALIEKIKQNPDGFPTFMEELTGKAPNKGGRPKLSRTTSKKEASRKAYERQIEDGSLTIRKISE